MAEPEKKQNGILLESFLSRELLRTSLLPLCFVALLMLALYFVMSYSVSSISLSTLHDTAAAELRREATQRGENLSSQLRETRALTEFLQNRVAGLLQADDREHWQGGQTEIALSKGGVLYYPSPQGCSMFWSLGRMPDADERHWIEHSSLLDGMMLDMLKVRPDFAAVYVNTADGYSRYCPPQRDFPLLETGYDIRDFSFFYLADSRHNPGKVAVWTPPYVDPAGKGHVVSCISPVYDGDELRAVVGVDVTVERIADRVLNMNLSGQSMAFLADGNGHLLALSARARNVLGISPKEQGQVLVSIGESTAGNARNAVMELLKGVKDSVHFEEDGRRYMITNGLVHETGWRLFVLADQDALLEPILAVERKAKMMGYMSLLGLTCFLVVLLLYLHSRSRKMVRGIISPMKNLSTASETIASGRYDYRVAASGIVEIDEVADNFNNMASDQQSLMQELRRSNEELEEYNRGLEEIVRQRTQEAESSFRIVEAELEERRKVEKQLEERTLFLHSMMDAVPLPVFYSSTDGVTQGCNRAFERFFGLTAEDLVGHRMVCVETEQQATALERLLDSLLCGESGATEHTVQNADGQWREIVFSSASYTDMFGNAAGRVGVVMDITERKRAEASIRESERNLRKVLDGIGAAIFIIDPNGFKVKDMNELAEELLGQSKEEYLGKECTELAFCGDANACSEGLCPLLAGDFKDMEMVLHRKDGKTLPVTKTVVTAKVNGVIHFFEIVFDISDRKDMERQLTTAQKLESIGQLAAGIAHEINTPTQYIGDNIWFLRQAFERLGGVLEAYSALLDHLKNSPELTPDLAPNLAEEVARVEEVLRKSKLDFILRQVPKGIEQSLGGVERVSSIVKAMKNFSHPDSKDRQPVDINAAVENTVTVARNEWKYVSEMETTLAPDLPPVLCFPSEVNQALLNIIVNAAHAIGDVVEGTGEKGLIRISTEQKGKNVVIRISDSGTGIKPENKDRIFDPFFTTKKIGKGTGQGLSIVYNTIVKNHGGTIDVDSRLGEGTTFILTLPVQGEKAEDERQA